MSDAQQVDSRVREGLDRLGIAYEVVECDPDFADTAQFCERYGFPMETSGNTIIVVGKSEPRVYCACVVQATRRLDVNHKVRDLLRVRRASFASADETRELTGMEIGGVTAFGLPADLPVYLDPHLRDVEYVILGSGTRHGKLRIAPGELSRIPNAAFVEGLTL